MRVLIVSDNHGHPHLLYDLVEKYHDTVDHMIHCGDSELAKDDLIWGVMTTVRGNKDDEPFKDVEIVTTEQGNIMVTHGHLFGVSYGYDKIVQLAQENDAQIVCYGHTHVMNNTVLDGVRLINPGSIRLPKGTYPFPSYAILNWQDEEMQVTFYNDEHEEISPNDVG